MNDRRTQTLVIRLTLFFCLLFGLALASRASTITVGAASIPNVQTGAGTYELRIWLDRTMVDSAGVAWPGGAVDSPTNFQRVSCSLAGTTVTCLPFTLASTKDAQQGADAKYTAKLYRNGAPLFLYNKPFALTASLGPSVTWEQIWRDNNTVPNRVLDNEYYTKNQVNALYAGSLFSNPATTTSRGVAKSSMNVADPVFVETTDTRIPTSAQRDAMAGTSGVPSSSNKFVTSSDARLPFFNVKFYGAAGDGVTNDLTAVRAAVAAAEAGGRGRVYFPAGSYLLSATTGTELLLITKALTLEGDGQNSKIVVGSSVPGTVDVIRYLPDLDAGSYWQGQSLYFKVRGLNIQPQSGTPARYGVVLDTSDNTARYAARALIEENQIGPFGSAGIYLHGHASDVENTFTSTVQRNQVMGGLLIVRGGDMLKIEDNQFTGAGSVDIEQVPYAAGLWFAHNGVTCSGGFLLRRSWNAHIQDNEFEAVSDDVGTPNGAYVDFAGASGGACGAGGNAVCAPVIRGNSVVIDTVAIDAFRFDYVSGMVFLDNSIDQRVGTKYHFKYTANSSGNLYGFNPVYGAGLGMLDSGASNVVVVYTNGTSAVTNNSGNINTSGQVSAKTHFTYGTLFADLGSPTAGTQKYCPDCNVATPCTGGGSGAWALANGSQWKCPF